MRRGVDVIHQATLVGDGLGGYADFLERVEQPSGWATGATRSSDAKLARITKSYFLVQLSVYAALLERLQGRPAGGAGRAARRWHARHVPHRRLRRLRARARDARPADDRGGPGRHLPAAVQPLRDLRLPPRIASSDAAPTTTCRWWPAFAATRSPGWSRRGSDADGAGGARPAITRCDAYPARHAEQAAAPGGAAAARAAHRRADVRVPAPTRPGYGFGQLPEPAAGDLYFDIEGDPYIGDKGLEYLFGRGLAGRATAARPFRPFWAHDRAEEKTAFEELIDFFMAWRERPPGQPHLPLRRHTRRQALKTLAMYHGTREDEVDHLLRSGALVDLYRVVRQGMRISKDSYSLKQVEDVLLARARGQGEGGGRLDRRLRALAGRAATRRRWTRSSSTTARTCTPPAACATGCWSCARS